MKRLILFTILLFLSVGLQTYPQQNQEQVAEFIVPPAGGDMDIIIGLTSALEATDTVRVRNQDTDIMAEFNPKKIGSINAKVKLTVIPKAVKIGLFHVDVISGDNKVKGSQLVNIKWPRIAVPDIRIWPLGSNRPTAANNQITVPTSATNLYYLELKLDSEEFLTSDRLKFSDPHIKQFDGDPNGPIPGKPGNSATYTIEIKDLQEPGDYTFEIVNPYRSGNTISQIKIFSEASPVISYTEPEILSAGGATITVHGSNYDNGATVELSGVHQKNRWASKYVSKDELIVKGTVDASDNTVTLKVQNPNGRSAEIKIPVRNNFNKLSIQELTNSETKLYAGESRDITLDLITDNNVPAPGLGTEDQYDIYLGMEKLNCEKYILPGGKIQLKNFVCQAPDAVSDRQIDFTRILNVKNNNKLKWQSDQGIVLNLRPEITAKAMLIDPPLMPGAECRVIIRGKHFRPNSLDIRLLKANYEIKPGTKEISNNEIQFTIMAKANALGAGPLPIEIIQENMKCDAGEIPITGWPDLKFINVSNGSNIGYPITEGLNITVGMEDDIKLIFQGDSSRKNVGLKKFNIQAVRDTIGDEAITKMSEIQVEPSVTKVVKVFNVGSRGLRPGQNAIIEVFYKDHPESIIPVTLKVERTKKWEHIGLLAGVSAIRMEIGGNSGNRNATLSDIHLGLEWIFSNSNNDIGLGGGFAVLGVPNGVTQSTKLGFALTGSLRYKSLTLLLGKQTTDDPTGITQASNSTDKSGQGAETTNTNTKEVQQFTAHPFYFMVGFSFGTNLAEIVNMFK